MRRSSLSIGESKIYADKNILCGDNFCMLPLGDLFHLGDIIRNLRKRKGIRIEDAKVRFGIDKSTMVRIEKGGNSDTSTLAKVAAGLGVTAADLLAAKDALKGESKPATYCPQHDEFHRKLEVILHGNEFWSQGIRANIEAMWASSTGQKPTARGDALPELDEASGPAKPLLSAGSGKSLRGRKRDD
jgi:transcriptional regulator with XRE-family HTH domain